MSALTLTPSRLGRASPFGPRAHANTRVSPSPSHTQGDEHPQPGPRRHPPPTSSTRYTTKSDLTQTTRSGRRSANDCTRICAFAICAPRMRILFIRSSGSNGRVAEPLAERRPARDQQAPGAVASPGRAGPVTPPITKRERDRRSLRRTDNRVAAPTSAADKRSGRRESTSRSGLLVVRGRTFSGVVDASASTPSAACWLAGRWLRAPDREPCSVARTAGAVRLRSRRCGSWTLVAQLRARRCYGAAAACCRGRRAGVGSAGG